MSYQLAREEIEGILNAAKRPEPLDHGAVSTSCENALRDLDRAEAQLSDCLSLIDCARRELCELYVFFEGCRDLDNVSRAERRKLARRALAAALNNLSCATTEGEQVARSRQEDSDAK